MLELKPYLKKRFVIPFVIVAIIITGIVVRIGHIPAGLRAFEALVRPVIHKETTNYFAGIYKEDPLFITSIISVESSFLRKAKSKRGAIGLMQIMPPTALEIAQELDLKDFTVSDLEDAEVNIRFGYHHISKLRKKFGDHDITILAAYNAGGSKVQNWLEKNDKVELTKKEIEFPATRHFVKNVLETYDWLKRLQKWRNKMVKKEDAN